MRRFLACAALLGACLAWGQDPPATKVRDDLGREVVQAGAGKRIATLSPFLTEAVAAVNAWPELVAVSEFSDFPPYVKSLPKVAGAAGIAWEKLAAARPDLVFAWKDTLREGDLQRFEQLKIPVFVVAGRRLDDVPRMVRTVALLLGRAAPEAVGQFEERIARLRAENSAKPMVTVLLEIQHRPLLTIAGAHFMNDALAVCNAENVFKDLPGVAPEVSWEALMARDPLAIVGAGAPQNDAAFRERWAEHRTLRAVKGNALVYVNGDHFYRPTLRLADGVAALCRGIDTVRK